MSSPSCHYVGASSSCRSSFPIERDSSTPEDPSLLLVLYLSCNLRPYVRITITMLSCSGCPLIASATCETTLCGLPMPNRTPGLPKGWMSQWNGLAMTLDLERVYFVLSFLLPLISDVRSGQLLLSAPASSSIVEGAHHIPGAHSSGVTSVIPAKTHPRRGHDEKRLSMYLSSLGQTEFP